MSEEIAAAFSACSNEEIGVGDVIRELREHIIGQYNHAPFATYKSDWIARVVNYAKSKSIPCVKSKVNWDPIATGIIDKFLAYSSDDEQNKGASSISVTSAKSLPIVSTDVFTVVSAGVPTGVSTGVPTGVSRYSASEFRRPSSASTVQSSFSNSPDSTSTKIPKLTLADKENIKSMYEDLDRTKMWKLSTGKIVEDKMKEVAMSLEYEHPSHSLILDITDSCWHDAFLPNEREEIRAFQSTDMPNMCDEAEAYLQKLDGLDEVELLAKVESDNLMMETDSKWIQKSYSDAFRLLRSDFFPLQNQTESSVVKRVWSCVDSCFDFSQIKCVSGEKCSRASADAGNKDRSVSDVGRQCSGRKIDYLFTSKKTEFEVGCGECALVGGVNTTKTLYDGLFKMPKVMRDMANSIFSTHSGLSHDMCIVGYLIAENAIQLLTLDFPAGYVARLDGFGPVYFPKVESQISHALPLVLRLIMAGRQIMEVSKAKIEQYKSPEVIARRGVVCDQIIPTFIPIAAQGKKRKLNNDL